MSKRITPNRYRLYWLPKTNVSIPTYALYDFVSGKTIAESGRHVRIEYYKGAKLLCTFDEHPGSFEDIRRDYPELFI